ncbi:MAG TPA: Fic family protein [Conexibacter sp.]|nr:Fic family protein [Conexibacter sp.]
MARPTTTFSLADQPEVFFSTTATSRAIRRLLAAGEIRHVAGRLYTRNVSDPLEAVVRRRVWDIAGGYFPGSTIVDRTAFEAAPADPDGAVFLCGPTRRVVRLPGVVLHCRRGPSPAEGDLPFLGGDLHLSSWPRKFLDNLRPTRARNGGARRTLTATELENELQRILVSQGDAGLNRLRDEARRLAGPLGAEAELARLDARIGALLGTRTAKLASPRARAARVGLGWDDTRLPLFDALLTALNGHVPFDRPERPAHAGPPFAFFEAYFSNYIEGTEFLVEEAEAIVFGGAMPADRPADAHDVLGTYDVVADARLRAQTPTDASSLEELLKTLHRRILSARPEAAPGEYKTAPNRAGATLFVAPQLVRGTLAHGLERYLALPPGFQRAAFAMFLVAEVHPFADGNGRVARALANAELSAAGQQRLIVPTVLRDDYVNALRALSHHANATPLIRVLDRTQDLCAQLDWRALEGVHRRLGDLHAFDPPSSGVRLRLPSELR